MEENLKKKWKTTSKKIRKPHKKMKKIKDDLKQKTKKQTLDSSQI